MLVFSCVFLVSSLVFTRLLGSVGFVVANCVNMLCRILHRCVHCVLLSLTFDLSRRKVLGQHTPASLVLHAHVVLGVE